MIKVTRLNNSQFWVNAELIEFIEETPDTVISILNKDKIVVKEPGEVIVKAVIAYRRQVFAEMPKLVERDKGEIG